MLSTSDTNSSDTIPSRHSLPQTVRFPSADLPPDAPSAPPKPATQWRVLFQIQSVSTYFVRLDLPDELVIGRPDPVSGFTPGLDLSPYDIDNAGVSRRHAMIYASQNGLYLRDLSSTNGSRINGVRLDANRLYPLHDGDEVKLGQLPIRLSFLESPFG